MILRGYRINSQMHLEAVSIDGNNLPELMKNGPLWLDIEAARPEELKEILAPLTLDPLVVEGCLAPSHRMRIEPFDDALFIEYPAGGGVNLESVYLRVICLRHLLLTIHDRSIPELEWPLRRASAIRLHDRSVAAILHSLLDRSHTENVRAALTMRDHVRQLADKIDDQPELVEGEDIQFLKRRTSVLVGRYEDQLACLTALRHVETEAFQLGSLRGAFDTADRGLRSLIRLMERLESQLQDVRQQFMTLLQDKTNRRLNVLTIVQAIFVPLTLIVGIYGMNFDTIPELHWPYAYFICLGVMVTLAVGEMLYFYRRGWFD